MKGNYTVLKHLLVSTLENKILGWMDCLCSGSVVPNVLMSYIYCPHPFFKGLICSEWELWLEVFVHHMIQTGTKVSVFAQGSVLNRMHFRHHAFFFFFPKHYPISSSGIKHRMSNSIWLWSWHWSYGLGTRSHFLVQEPRGTAFLLCFNCPIWLSSLPEYPLKQASSVVGKPRPGF